MTFDASATIWFCSGVCARAFCFLRHCAPPSPDTWEYELSHVIDIYADDFVHRSLVALTSWPEVPEQDKIKAFNLLVGFVNELIERVGIHSLRSSTYGLNPDNMNLNYRSCQRAGSVTVAVVGFFSVSLVVGVAAAASLSHSIVPVLLVNMYNLHAAAALRSQDAPLARQSVADLASCIAGARASGHSVETLPAYVEVHKKLESMLRSFDATA
jgi:hypothetical protein